MIRNIGKFDRTLRLLVAAVVAGLYFAHIIHGILGIALLALAGVFLATSLFRFCPLYAPFGIRTDGNDEKKCC